MDGTVIKLGRWVDKQRQFQRKNTLKRNRENLLQSLVNIGK